MMKTRWFNSGIVVGILLPALVLIARPRCELVAAEAAKTRVLIVAGPSKHPPGTHEVAAGARVVKYMLEHAQGIPPVAAEVFYEWPTDKAVLDKAATIVFTGDLFPGETLADPAKVKADVATMMDRGCGMVCLHFATGLRAQHMTGGEDHPLVKWLGGCYYDGKWRVLTATLVPEKIAHPVLRGWKEFTLEDEPYWHNYFGKSGPAKNVTPLVTAMLPPEEPKKETVGWAVQRADGGRGVGIVVPHFFHNWKIADLRTLVLNAVCWSAKLEIPAEGVRCSLPDLATFEPTSVEPQPKPNKKAK